MQEPKLDQVLEAISIMFSAQKQPVQVRRNASKWLESFQKQSAAWIICDSLIKDPNAPDEAKLFAAQTFRQKIEFDLDQLDLSSIESLRNSVLGLLYDYRNGPKALVTQLAIALADLAVQMPSWSDPIGNIMSQFQQEINILLEFLTVLPEELIFNRKINIDSSFIKERENMILKPHAERVLTLLLNYLETALDNDSAMEKVLACLESWLRASAISLQMIQSTNLISFLFGKLDSCLFELCVDVICEIIVQSASPRNDAVIEKIYPYLSLNESLKNNQDNPEFVRGIARILVEAGESYAELICSNFNAFQHILQGILFCAAYEDLDIARITFGFWFRLADVMPQDKTVFIPIYQQLVDVMIKHLYYPDDLDNWKAQERDEFREFRHVMGDVLKDCVRVLGDEALAKPLDLLNMSFDKASQLNTAASWQGVEAPLFSLRTMCRQIENSESKYLPQIMQLLPKLPNHPKVRYAAILVIGRYAEWTNLHPEFLEYQISFVSQGFESNLENQTAAAHAFKDLCKYCSKHLVKLLHQLHPFYLSTLRLLHKEDRQQLTEAVSHILTVVPVSELHQALQLFCLPAAQGLAQHMSKGIPQGDEFGVFLVELREKIDELSTFFRYVKPEITASEHPCIQILEEMWPMFDNLFKSFGSESIIAEALCRLFRNGMESYKSHYSPVLSLLLPLFAASFCKSGFPCYLWVSGHSIRIFGTLAQNIALLQNHLKTLSESVFKILEQPNALIEQEEIIEEYYYLLTQAIMHCSNIISSDLYDTAMDCGIFALSSPSQIALAGLLDFFIQIVQKSTVDPLCMNQVQRRGPDLIKALFSGLVGNFPRDRQVVEDMADCLLSMYKLLGQQLVECTTKVICEWNLEPDTIKIFTTKFAA